jgi:hypothetical protein
VNRYFIDDYLDCSDTAEECLEITRNVTEVHSRRGFEICKWVCSSREVLMKIPSEIRADSTKDSNMETRHVWGPKSRRVLIQVAD